MGDLVSLQELFLWNKNQLHLISMRLKLREYISRTTSLLESLNLFKSNFEMKANLSKLEPDTISWWKSNKVYEQIRKAKKAEVPFILLDGPPYANGTVHIGHALNKILKDIIIKSKGLDGHNAPFDLGWDCHGMPIEVQVGASQKKFAADPLRLLQSARVYAAHQVGSQKSSFNNLGLMANWNRPILTMDKLNESAELRTFVTLIKRDLIRRGSEPTPWCPSCRSTLAGAEVESKLMNKLGAYVIFPFLKTKTNFQRIRKKLQLKSVVLAGGACLWTTTPWTIISNKAISINPNDHYIVGSQDGRIIVCSERTLDQYVCRSEAEVVVLGALKGTKLQHLRFQHPYYNLLRKYRRVPLNLIDPLIRGTGTGLVHISPAHGVEDFCLFKSVAGERVLNSVSKSGFHKSLLLKRKHYYEVDLSTVAWLSFQRALVRCIPLTDHVTLCWRHQSRTFFRMTEQWTANLDVTSTKLQVKNTALACLKNIVFRPPTGKQVLMKILWNRPSWILSRQRMWGVPIAAYLKTNTKSFHPFSYLVFNIVSIEIEKLGIEAWAVMNLLNFRKEKASEYDKLSDVLDVWFDSGCSWLRLKCSENLRFPADMFLEGPDQYRGWFYSSLVSSTLLNKMPPTKIFAVHGFVVNSKGEKISKSRMNTENANALEESAEILRSWVASMSCWQEINISKDAIKNSGEIYRKIRNTIRFLLSNLVDFDVTEHFVPYNQFIGIDNYILLLTKIVRSNLILSYKDYNHKNVVRMLVEYCTDDLGRFYLDIVKERLYISPSTSAIRRSAQNVLYYIACFILKSTSPILSFTAEEAWHTLKPWCGSVFLSRHQSFPVQLNESPDHWTKLKQLRERGLRTLEFLKSIRLLSSNLEVMLRITSDGKTYVTLSNLGRELRSLFLVSKQRTIYLPNPGENLMGMEVLKHSRCSRCWQRSAASCERCGKVVCVGCKTILQHKLRTRKFI